MCEADMVHRTHTDATRHARPRGRACEAHTACKWRVRRVQRGHVAGGHAGPHGSTRMLVRGATWRGGWRVKGPQVIGPWLGDWGGNTNALPRPRFYTHDSLPFCPCGTMFPRTLLLQVTWMHSGHRIRSSSIHRVDSGPRVHQSSTCVNNALK